MKFSQKLYDRSQVLIKSSSDFAIFKYPKYTSLGMDKIMSGITSVSDNVYIIDNDIDFNVDVTFTDNLDQLTDGTKFNYYILPYDIESGVFTNVGVYTSDIFDYTVPNHTNIINTLDLLGEGEYLFKLGYQYDMVTEVANKLGKRQISNTFNNTLPYGNYDENLDKYFVILYKAEEPLLDVGIADDGVDEGSSEITSDKITISNMVAEEGVSEYPMSIQTTGDIIITWNGSVLTKDQDYALSDGIIRFFEPLHKDDLVNVIFIGKSNTSGLRTKSIVVSNPIDSGITGEEGENNVFYNTVTEKFEIYTDYRISNPNSFIVMLNGQTLTNQIDYFVSSSNAKRVILSGEIKVNDILTIIYDSGENLVRAVTTDYVDISWYVTKNILNDNGEFIIEVCKDKYFINIEQSIITPYVVDQLLYTKRVPLNYDFGQVLYYRIRNVKRYQTISEDNLNTENVSDVIRIEIKTNISNNY